MIRVPLGPLGSLAAIELSRAGKRNPNGTPRTELPHPTREPSAARWLWLACIALAILGVSFSYIPAMHQALIALLT